MLSITASIGLPKPVASADTKIKSPSFISLLFDFVTDSKFLSIFNFSLDGIDYITFGVLLFP